MRKFEDRLLWLVSQHANGKYTVFAKNAGIPHSTLQNYVKGRMPHADHLLRIHITFNVNLNWLLSGEGDPYVDEGEGPDRRDNNEINPKGWASNVIETEYADIIRRYRDKPYARDMNLDLVELERLNPEAFRKVGAYVKGVLDGTRTAAKQAPGYMGPDRRKEQRRIADRPEKIPETGDRRNGLDRRRTAIG